MVVRVVFIVCCFFYCLNFLFSGDGGGLSNFCFVFNFRILVLIFLNKLLVLVLFKLFVIFLIFWVAIVDFKWVR